MANQKSTSAWNREELESLHVTFNQRSAARTTAIMPGIVQHLKPQPLRHVHLQGFKNMESICNEEFLSMARTLVLDYKGFLEDQLSRLLNLALLKREHSLSTAYNLAMLATMGPSEVESLVCNTSNSRYLAGHKNGFPFVAFYDGAANTAVIFLAGAVDQINGLATSSRMKERPFVALYDGMVATAQIFLPGAVEQAYALAPSNGLKAGRLRRSYVACYEGEAAFARALMPVNAQLKPRPLRHVPLVGFKSMESASMTYNEEFLSTVRTLVLDYRDFLQDQLSSLLNLAILKHEQSLSTAYNQAMLATMGPREINRLVIPSSNPRYMAGPNKGLPFVAFYNGTANTAVIFLPGAVDQINGFTTSSRKKVGPFAAFYDGIEATAQISLQGAVEQTCALTTRNGSKTGLWRRSYVALSEIRAASASALMLGNAQHLKPQPLRHVQLVGSKNYESPYNEEFLSMVRTLVLDYREFLEDQLSSLLNLAHLKREHNLSVAYNQAMLATMGPAEVESLVSAPSNPRYLARLPFIAFYEEVVATAVVFLSRHVTIPPSRPSTPRKSTRMETKPSQDIVHNDGIVATAHIFLPFLQKKRQSDVQIINPRPLVRPKWSWVEKCRLLKDKLDGLPLRYKPRTAKYITFEEKEIDTRQRILNTIPSLKTVSPGSCLAQSPLTPFYSLEDTYPDMVSATLTDLATQHMKYFRASPSRAPGRRAGRTQIQILEDLYWEMLRKMGAPETADEIACRRQQEICFTRKLWYGSVIKRTKLKSDHKGKSMLNTRAAQLNDTACLNTNNNGYTKEEGDCDRDTTDSSVFGSKSDQGFSIGQDLARKKPRHSYLNKRHSDGYRSRNRGPAGVGGTYADFHKTHLEPAQHDSGMDTGQFADSPLLQCQSKDSNFAQRGPDKTFNPPDRGLGRMSLATHEPSTLRHGGKFFEEALFQKGTLEDDAINLKELFKDVSNFDSLSDVPESILQRVLLLTCKPFLKDGYSSGLSFLSNLIESPECSPVQPIQNLEHCTGQCTSAGSAAVSPTDSSTEEDEDNTIQKQRDALYRETCGMRLEQFPVFEAKSTHDDDFMGDLSFTDNSPDDRAESPRSFLHDEFIHEDDVLDIPTLSILSPSRASLGQAYHSDHGITSLCTLDHDEYKPASHEPFPSEYVFKRACGRSFRVSSEFWHIQIPTLPSDMVDYKVESDGLTEIVIGSGGFGDVYAATLMVSPGQSRDVVVKEHFTDKTTQESIANEAKITMYLESTGCVPICYGLLSDEEDGYNIVMEYVGTGQTLYDVMRELELPRLHWLNIVCQLVSGLNKIHKKDVLINDIKSDNILVDMSGELPLVKFCDMGTASYKSGVTYRGDMKNCVHLAPEACAHAETTAACDVFSLGRVLKKIHGVSHISTLLVLSDLCMAEEPSSRPTLEAANQLLQGEYTREIMFPTLTVPSHGYLDCIDEESQEETPGSILRVNTPVDTDLPTPAGPGTAEVSGAVSGDSKSGSCSQRSSRSGKVSPSNDKASVTTISLYNMEMEVWTLYHQRELVNSPAFSSPNGSYGFYAPPVPPSSPASSCASCHLHPTSSSMELSLAAISPKFAVTMETLDTASSEHQTSPSHTYHATSETFVDALEDHLDADADPEGHHTDVDVNEAAVVDVDGNPTSPSLEALHVAEYRVLCQAELEVYNKYCEDTSVYENYLPLVLPLLMLPLGFFGFI
ncbi:uncharacterized protein LOC124264244 [Haliotis rubra]|uniref:uncharacterized protein LOC124264244 n=1 Tax=Haliotis rubra TaxID=36100 RepID=UPI001EE53CC3|nr:uncharacterized protein LOC124264244 [Haliotis rubra]